MGLPRWKQVHRHSRSKRLLVIVLWTVKEKLANGLLGQRKRWFRASMRAVGHLFPALDRAAQAK